MAVFRRETDWWLSRKKTFTLRTWTIIYINIIILREGVDINIWWIIELLCMIHRPPKDST